MLIGLGIPREEAEFYEGEFRAGRTLVTVKTEGRGAEAQSILRRHGGYDISTRGQLGSKTPMAATPTHSALAGSTAKGSKAGDFKSSEACPPAHKGTAAAAGTFTGASAASHGKIQASEEELRVCKEREQAGEVTVRKEVHTEHKTLEVPVEREEVVVERHPVSGHQPAASQFKEGQTIRVPVTEEHIHVEKTPVVKEEVEIGKEVSERTQAVDETVRRTEVEVEDLPASRPQPGQAGNIRPNR